MITELDKKYMKECFSLAMRGKGTVLPNPMVGCVVLDKEGNVVSKGYHKKYGENHAERDALTKLKNNEAEGGTLYVNLEPCSHYGKTPPCVDIIIEHKIKKVVIGMRDVNPKVDGISKLKEAGVEVLTGVLEDEAIFLNRIFIKNVTKKLPYVVLKTATTIDGKIATSTGSSKWITSAEARDLVYEMRKEFDCILTSSNTVLADNPKMEHKFKCILDKDLRVSGDFEIFSQGQVYVASAENTLLKDGYLDLFNVLQNLYAQGIYTVFVECGGKLAGALLKEGLVDEIYHFIAPKILNDNSGKSCFDGDFIENISQARNLKIYDSKMIGVDLLVKSVFV